MTHKKHPVVFISAGIRKWYEDGVDRFRGSMIQHGPPVDFQFWKNEWPPWDGSRDCIYNIKAAAFQHAINSGYRTIIWGDASVYALKNAKPFIDVVNSKGYWLGQSGHNAAQTCSDACLAYFGVDRDTAAGIHDCATGLFGVNLDFPQAARFIERFIKAGREGAFHGSRKHDGQSKDHRFLYHRQDQSAATIIAWQEGLKLDLWQSYVIFAWDKQKDHHLFGCQGM